jgi:hypothetical protein
MHPEDDQGAMIAGDQGTSTWAARAADIAVAAVGYGFVAYELVYHRSRRECVPLVTLSALVTFYLWNRRRNRQRT